MYNKTNTPAFFFEICNLWQTQNMVQKNFQCFFIFSNDAKETFYKVPSLSFKIKTKSDFDNTEVKLYANYETLPDLVYTIDKYVESSQNQMIQLAGHGYTFFLSRYPSNDGIEYTTIKLSDSNSNSNDFVMRTSGLKFMVRTLKMACDNMIKLALDFIKVAQNNEILNRMIIIDEGLKRINNNVTPSMSIPNEPTVDTFEAPKVDATYYVQTAPKPIEPPTPTEEVPIPQETFKPIPVADEKIETGVPAVVSQEETNEMFQGLGQEETSTNDSLEVGEAPKLEEPIKEAPIQDKLNKFIKQEISKPADVRMKEKVLSTISQAYNKQISTYGILDKLFAEHALISKESKSTFSGISNYTCLTYSSFIRYFQKLALVTDLHKVVTSSVPLFIIKCKFDELYLKETKLLNECLVDLYVEYRNKQNKTDEDEYTYACFRYVLAPLWTTFLAVNKAYDSHPSDLIKKIRSMTIVYLQNWKETYDKTIDDFIYNNKLVLDYKDGNVEKLMHMFCPTIYECFKSVDSITLENVSAVRYMIMQLKETFAYEEVVMLKSFNFSLLNEQFLKVFKTFSKANNINNDTKEVDLLKYHQKVITDFKVENIISEFKGLQVIDMHDNELKKNQEQSQ